MTESETAPVLALHADIWRHIISHVTFKDVWKLFNLRNPTITQVLVRLVSKMDCNWFNVLIDFELISRMVSHFPNIKNISIISEKSYFRSKQPLNIAIFPSQLVSLTLDFNCSASSILSNPEITTSLAQLEHLLLSDSSSLEVDLGQSRFPPHLLTLSLNVKSVVYKTGDFARLPRSLTFLSLSSCRSTTAPKYEEFPPELKSLILRHGNFTLNELPHCLTRLELHYANISSPYTSGDTHFPWRSYFPALTDFFDTDIFNKSSLRSLFDPQALYTDESFASLLRVIKEDRKRYELLLSVSSSASGIGYSSLELDSTDLEFDDLESPVPSLRSMRRLQAVGCNIERLENFLPDLRSLDLTELPSNFTLPSRITTLSISHIRINLIPPTVTSLACDSLRQSTDDVGSFATEIFPSSSLQILHLWSDFVTSDLASILPASITDIRLRFPGTVKEARETKILPDLSSALAANSPTDNQDTDVEKYMNRCDRSWRVLVKRLVNLRKMAVVDSIGCPSMALTPFVSPYLDTFSFKTASYKEFSMLPWCSALFDGMNSCGRPEIFPPSLRTLEFIMYGVESLPLTVLALAPRSLTSLSVSHMAVNTDIPNSPLASNLSASQILALLPPKLRFFYWAPTMTSYGTAVVADSSCISLLPRTLSSFDPSSLLLFKMDDSIPFDQLTSTVAPMLPPNITRFSVYLKHDGSKYLFSEEEFRNFY